MRFSCTQENLKRGLAISGSLSGKNVNLPILSNVLIRTEGSTITLLSTNLEIAVSCGLRGKVDEPGEFTVPAKLFLDYVNLLPEDKVDMELIGENLKVTCRKNTTKIKGLASSEFPLIPGLDRQTAFYLDAHDLKDALKQTLFAASNVESRPELTGVFFNINPKFAPGKVVLAATDSYRLAERTIGLKDGPSAKSTDKSVGVIVPGRTLHEVARILSIFKDDELDAPVEIVLGESQVAFHFADVELISRVIEGRYPDYRPIIPERFTTEATVGKDALAQAVKGAALFARSGLQDVHFSLEASTGITVASAEGQLGKNESQVEAAVTGGKNAITVNYKYFLDGLTAADGSKMKFRMIDAMNPCVLTPENADNGYLYIVMPIKQ